MSVGTINEFSEKYYQTADIHDITASQVLGYGGASSGVER